MTPKEVSAKLTNFINPCVKYPVTYKEEIVGHAECKLDNNIFTINVYFDDVSMEKLYAAGSVWIDYSDGKNVIVKDYY